ncbi:MAG TPA: MBL fold metallo-hydrolase [Methanomicrobia archaeon]|nr:MBL fold metallo-hydrolase [Methanomicrobia archaeon]
MKVYALGGYEEVGKNMTAIEVDKKVLILDMGIRLDRIMISEDTNLQDTSTKELNRIGAIPDIAPLKRKKVVGVVVSHGHLDHIGAIARLARRFKCPILGKPYPLKLVASILKEERKPMPNPLFEVQDSSVTIGPFDIRILPVTHSIPQAGCVVVSTSEGDVFFTGDYKLDNHQRLQKPLKFSELKKLDIKILITDSTNVQNEGITPSEKVARTLVSDYMGMIEDSDKGIVTSTFSSQVERILTIIDEAERIGRKPVLVGKSLCKYYGLALEMGIIDKPVQMIRKRDALESTLREINKKKDEYVVLATGSQGEQDAILSRITDRKLPYTFGKDDTVIFSASVVPNPLNMAARYRLETKLKMQDVRVVKNLHVSGHASREEHRKMIRTLSPDYVLPCHGAPDMLMSMAELCNEEGYAIGSQALVMRNGQSISI